MDHDDAILIHITLLSPPFSSLSLSLLSFRAEFPDGPERILPAGKTPVQDLVAQVLNDMGKLQRFAVSLVSHTAHCCSYRPYSVTFLSSGEFKSTFQ